LPRRIVLGLMLVAVHSFLHGCGDDAARDAEAVDSRPASIPVVVVGMDGLDWQVILPMLAEGRLPNMAGLMERGTYGYLESRRPTFSPILWTSIATGKGHRKHGIHQFARRTPDGRITLYNSADRTTKAVWNILSDYGKRVSCVGWWMTYPVEEINGVMVAQTNTLDQLDMRAGKNVWKGTLLRGVPGQVYPVERQNAMMAILVQVNMDLPALVRQIFEEFRYPMSLLGRRMWNNCQWAFRADATYLRIATTLARERPLPDVTLLYFGGPDVVGHRFWRYREPDLYRHRPTDQQIANFGHMIEQYYAYIDQALGQVLGACGPDVRFFVVSDHGMHPVNLEARFDPDDPPSDIDSGGHPDAPPGVFIAAGPGIRASVEGKRSQDVVASDLETVGSVLDVTPTILAMMRIRIGQDMDGLPLVQLFEEEVEIARQPAPVPTHDTAEFLAGRGHPAPTHPGEQERLEQLRRLGYIDE